MEKSYTTLSDTDWPVSMADRQADRDPAAATLLERISQVTGIRPPDPALDKAKQNEKALDEFLAAREMKAFHIAQASLWDREAALDVVQESMYRLVRYYRKRPESEWPALFQTILMSCINDVRRKRMIEQGRHKLVSLTGLFRRSPERGADNEEYELPAREDPGGVSTPESDCFADQIRTRIEHAMQTLSERQRQVFILREWRGMSISEAAQILGCSENTIKQHHFRAMRELRSQLAGVFDHAQTS